MTSAPAMTLAPSAAAAGPAPAAGFDAAFEISRPPDLASPLVFASPHSGRVYPEEMTSRSPLTAQGLRRSEDMLVDDLVACAPALGWPLIAARYARAYVDLNRAAYELDAAMFDGRPARPCTRTPRAAAGLGSVPRVVAAGAEIYDRRLHFREVEARLKRVHIPYHAALATLMDEAAARFGCAVLIDWHSMPSAAVEGPGRPDAVVGDRHGRAAAPAVTAAVEAALGAVGLRVARNHPYAGGHVAEAHGRPAARRHAVQVELRRDLYLDEAALAPADGYARLKAAVRVACERLGAAPWTAIA